MDKKTLHEQLIEELKFRIPNNSELVNKLSDILYLGREAIYRRMRGDVHFSLEEASIISEKMDLSLDSLSKISGLKRPFVFKIANFSNPEEIDYKLINETVEFLDFVKDSPDSEMGTAAKLIPDAIHLSYDYITRFYLFKWIYQYDNQSQIRKFEDVKGTDRLLKILGNMTNRIQHIKNSYYIFDKRIFEYLVDDIKYFESIGLITQQDIKLLKEDLYACINDIELQAAKGMNSMGNKTQIYLSNLNFEAGFSYVRSDNYNLSTIRAFTMYDITSTDNATFANSMKWMQSLKRASSLISQSGEIERMNFFRKQNDIVDTL
ncbi:hypothetical protein [Prevotella sp. 10(H)]|uniref:hypothetical protein n=1 Tax=Prevotella sp. 10(H) TaxID=1158294 RepID=UPI0004A73F09|nr:hypothetical protein [Prevotella sp. 10(H)]